MFGRMHGWPTKLGAWIGYMGLSVTSILSVRTLLWQSNIDFFFSYLSLYYVIFILVTWKLQTLTFVCISYLTRRLPVAEWQWVILASGYGARSCLGTWAQRHLQKHLCTVVSKEPFWLSDADDSREVRCLVTGTFVAESGAANANRSQVTHRPTDKTTAWRELSWPVRTNSFAEIPSFHVSVAAQSLFSSRRM